MHEWSREFEIRIVDGGPLAHIRRRQPFTVLIRADTFVQLAEYAVEIMLIYASRHLRKIGFLADSIGRETAGDS